MKTVQYFTKEYLEQCAKLSTAEILDFLEDFRRLHFRISKNKLISLKVPESLLNAFKVRARLQGIPYQTQIKILMEEWLSQGLQMARSFRYQTANNKTANTPKKRSGDA